MVLMELFYAKHVQEMKMKSNFDKKLRKEGASLVLSIPYDTVEKLGLKVGDIVEVELKKGDGK